ncbi:MAG: NAD(P)H-dependent glycerol-3-phosphate dehydrogenase [Bdellovibrionota bacterium]
MQKDFWSNSTVAVLGAGSWGTVLAHLASKNVREVRLWARDEMLVREINATRVNARYHPELTLGEKVRAYSQWEKVFPSVNAGNGPDLVVWGLPSRVCREQAKILARHLRGDEIIIHATKGVEEGSLKRISEVLLEELPTPRVGVISGPNLSREMAKGEPAATVIASRFDEVIDAGQKVFSSPGLRVYGLKDIIGVEWAGTLKNILAISAGALDALGLGWNSRAMLITRGLAEMVRFGKAMGAEQDTFLGLAGIGDLLATASSPLSRNYRVGYRMAKGEKLPAILADLGSTAEGVRTTEIIYAFAKERGISMPIMEAVWRVLSGAVNVQDGLHELMVRPLEPGVA